MTYLAREEEALAKRKGRTLYAHKLHGCGLGGWFSLINKKKKGTKRQSWRRAAHIGEERNTACQDKGGIRKAGLLFLTHVTPMGVFSFPLILIQPVPPSPPPTLSQRLRTQRREEPRVQGRNGNKKGTRN